MLSVYSGILKIAPLPPFKHGLTETLVSLVKNSLDFRQNFAYATTTRSVEAHVEFNFLLSDSFSCSIFFNSEHLRRPKFSGHSRKGLNGDFAGERSCEETSHAIHNQLPSIALACN